MFRIRAVIIGFVSIVLSNNGALKKKMKLKEKKVLTSNNWLKWRRNNGCRQFKRSLGGDSETTKLRIEEP
jgi:hypothetical protein